MLLKCILKKRRITDNHKKNFLVTLLFLTGIGILVSCAPQIRYAPHPTTVSLKQKEPVAHSQKSIDPDFSIALPESDQKESTDGRLRIIIGSYIGVPYKSGGETRRGLDCSGYVTVVFRDYNGLSLPRSSSKMFLTGKKIKERDLKCGDLVFFRGALFGSINHVGIYVNDSWFAHASTSSGVMYSSLSEDYYKKRFAGARRIL